MDREITIDGKEIKLKATGAWATKYRGQFGHDPFKKIFAAQNAMTENGIDFEKFDIEFLYNLLWSFAKNADAGIPCLEKWLDSFDVLPIFDIAADVIMLAVESMTTKAIPEKK